MVPRLFTRVDLVALITWRVLLLHAKYLLVAALIRPIVSSHGRLVRGRRLVRISSMNQKEALTSGGRDDQGLS